MTLRAVVFTDGHRPRTAIPPEAAHRMGVVDATGLCWTADAAGGRRVFPTEQATGRLVRAHEEAVREFGAVFRTLARGMAGDLSLKSTRGRGSTFTLHRPAAPPTGTGETVDAARGDAAVPA